MLSTTFGEIPYYADKSFFTINDSLLFYKMIQLSQEDLSETEYLVEIESLIEEFPNEPFIHGERTGILHELGEDKKADLYVVKDAQRFPNHPLIEVRYVQQQYIVNIENIESLATERFGQQVNITQAYPTELAFSKTELSIFYNLWAQVFIDKKDWQNAQDCVDVLHQLGQSTATIYLQHYLNSRKRPIMFNGIAWRDF